MRAIMLLIVGYSLSELGFTGDRGGQPAPCSAPELSGVSRAYDALVCAGLASYREAQYATAVERFVAARKIPLEDFPNVWILARLAQAQWMSGDRIGAKSTLAQAELSIQILTGVFVCTFDDANAAVSDRLGRAISARGS